MNSRFVLLLFSILLVTPCSADAAVIPVFQSSLTSSWAGYLTVWIFLFAYALAMLEDWTLLRKSKPMVFAASLIWIVIGYVYSKEGLGVEAGNAFRKCLENYGELFLFIMVSMTYLNAMEQRGVFDNLRSWLLSRGYGYRQLFWITGLLSFALSSFCTNLTTALLMGTVVLSIAGGNKRFISIACVNIVVATNAGGSFSPFGDITTLLVWQRGVVPFGHFFSLFLPAVVNFVVPASIMHFWIPKHDAPPMEEVMPMPRGSWGILILFILTILTAVFLDVFLDMPPAAGMLAGLSYLSFYFFYLYKTNKETSISPLDDLHELAEESDEQKAYFDVFHNVARLEWDTLLYFYGVLLSLGGLSFIGYMSLASRYVYSGFDPTIANILIGLLSAIIDNGTIMYAVIAMDPNLPEGQWLLVTLAAGVGGSLLAIGSAAGVGLLGLSQGSYTYKVHMKWTPVILLGYVASVATHLLINTASF